MLRSIYLVRDSAVSSQQILFVRNAIEVFLDMMGLTGKIDLAEVDLRITAGKKIEDYLFLALTGKPPTKMIDTDLLDNLITKDLRNLNVQKIRRPHYIFVLKRDLRYSASDLMAIDGLYNADQCIYINTQNTQNKTYAEREVKLTTLHEFGHLFGLVPKGRKSCVVSDRGEHCSNRCVMRRTTPNFLTRLKGTKLSRFLCGKFCRLCHNFLMRKFPEKCR